MAASSSGWIVFVGGMRREWRLHNIYIARVGG